MTTDALILIDAWLQRTPHRDQFSAGEVEDLLLDLRTYLTVEGALATS